MTRLKRNIAKILSFLIMTALIFPAFCVSSFSVDPEVSESPFYNITCVYDANAESVKIEYRMKNEDVKKYSGHDIFIYALPVNTTVDYIEANEIEPVSDAITPSNRSMAEIPVSGLFERLSAYVLVIDTGEEKVYSEIISPKARGFSVSSPFKGIDTSKVSLAVESMAGTAILDVNTDMLDGGSSGYLYTAGNKTYTFSSSYLSYLDGIMKIYRGSGIDVYLRFISETDPTLLLSGGYNSQRNIYAYTSFLLSRYNTDEFGGVSGMIIGEAISAESQELIKNYGASLCAAAVAIEDIGSECSLILPLTGNALEMKSFLNAFGDASVKYGFPQVTVMIESNRAPYGINEAIINAADSSDSDEGIDKNFNYGYVSPENIESFESYIKTLSHRTDSVYPTMIYHWTPSDGLGESAAVAAYVYNFYELYFESTVSSFIVSFDFSDEAYEVIRSLSEAVRYIDSNLHSDHIDTDKILEYFGFSSWETEIDGFSETSLTTNSVKETEISLEKPSNIIGVYNYFDFSSAAGMSGWYEGSGCEGIMSGKTDFGKSLSAKITDGNGFIAYNYKYSESFKYTDAIALNISLEGIDALASSDGKYKLYVILGGDNFRFEYSADGFELGKKHTVYADVSQLTESNEVKYMWIGAAAEGDSSEAYKIHVYSVNAESTKYGDKELTELIEAERERLKSEDGVAKRLNRRGIAFIIVTVFITAVVMIMISRRSRKSVETNDQNRD